MDQIATKVQFGHFPNKIACILPFFIFKIALLTQLIGFHGYGGPTGKPTLAKNRFQCRSGIFYE